MKKYLFLGFCLLLGLYSCATVPQTPDPGAEEAVENKAPSSESVDTDCSYFYFLWGRSAELDKHLEEAEEAYEKALVCDPDSDFVMRKLSLLLLKLGKKQAAVNWVEKIISLKPSDINARLLLAKIYTAMGDMETAVATYKDILEIIPDDVNSMLLLGSLYANNRQYDDAREIFEKIIQINQDSYMGHFYLGRLYRELRLPGKAIESYKKALAINWSEHLAFELGQLYEFSKRYDAAIEIYRRILERDEGSEQVRGRIVNIYLWMNKPELALEELRALKNYSSDVSGIDLTIGRILLDMGRLPEAVENFTAMLDDDPDNQKARYLLALIYNEQGKKAEAEQLLRKVPASAEVYEEALLVLVRILREEERKDEAEILLLEAIGKEDTRRKTFYIILAGLYQQDNRIEQAEELFKQAEMEYVSDQEVLFEFGLFYDRIGRQEKAMEKMQEVLTINPNAPYALNYVGYTWADQGINLDKARSYIEQAVALKPQDGFIRDSMGWVYFRLGDIDRALLELEKAVALESGDPTIREHLGDAYLKAQKVQEALAAYRKALELYKEEAKKQAVKVKIDALETGG